VHLTPTENTDLDLTGGFGGAGGAGGSGAAGGSGGSGGSADGSLSSSTPGLGALRSFATGGYGGAGGAAGAGAAVGAGAAGGDAVSSSELLDATLGVSSNQIAGAQAFGGVGGQAGGPGGTAGSGGNATASTHAATGGGNATSSATAFGGAGASATGAGSIGGSGGSATSHAQAESVTGYLNVFSDARGGAGGAGESDSGNGGAARSGAIGTSATDIIVDVRADAFGGAAGGAGGDGGAALLDPVVGTSTGGATVSVSGVAIGGDGDHGGSVNLVNAVNGSTSGVLILAQSAAGGSGRITGGSGNSALEVEGSSQLMTGDVSGHGGDSLGGGFSLEQSASQGYGAVRLTNHGGGAQATARGTGGNRGTTPVIGLAGDGGTGAANAVAITDGDSHAAVALAAASGGTGEVASIPIPANPSPTAGPGGLALAAATAQANGDSEAIATSFATGGAGGSSRGLPSGFAGDGGDAFADALSSTGGVSRSFASSQAVGGVSGQPGDNQGYRGAANSNSFALGLRDVKAQALSLHGSELNSRSLATGGTPYVQDALAALDVFPASDSSAYTQAAMNQPDDGRDDAESLRSQFGSVALSYSMPSAAKLSTWVDEHPNTEAALGDTGHAIATALVATEAGSYTTGSLGFGILPEVHHPGVKLYLALLDAEVGPLPFDFVHLEIDGPDHSLTSIDFADGAEFTSFFDDRVYELVMDGFDLDLPRSVSIRFETSAPVAFAIALFTVPEAPGALLVAIALLAVIALRGSTSHRRAS
jgi:hypothetical protein